MILVAPVLFAVGFVLNLYLGNITELSLPVLIAPIGTAGLLTIILTLMLGGVLKNKVRGVVLTSVLVIAFFALGKWPVLGVVVIAGAFILVRRTKQNLVTLAKYLTFTAIIIVAIAGVRIGIEEQQKAASVIYSPLKLPIPVKQENLPDIYYIIPDSYSASKSLVNYYGYDNSEFENFLTAKGFYIASESASNYPKTFLSLGSSLNMEYLDYLSENKNSKNLSLVDPLMEDNNVVKFLKASGYKYYHLGSWWGATHTNRNADFNVILENEKPVPISQFDYIVLQSTILDPVVDNFLPKLTVGDSDEDRMNRLFYQFRKLRELPNQPGPKFVFAHIIAPHEPYVFDKNCAFQSAAERKKIPENRKYIGQVACINKQLESVVTEIINNSERPPVILIQSDEGAPFLAERMKPPDSWGKASSNLLQEKFPVFNAYLLPQGNKKLYPSITPVNSFRLVFNEYLGTNFPLLPDKSYILPDLKHLYDFVDVTDRIK